MGLFDKLKNILFEDEEGEELPDYSKQEVKEQPVVRREKSSTPEIVESTPEESEPVVTENRFKNVKRDIELSYDDEDIFKEIARDQKRDVREEVKAPIVPEIHVEPKEEKRSVFQNFDADEFEKLNSRIANNEARSRSQENLRRDEHQTAVNGMNPARRANNNFSATTPNREIDRDPNRYKIEEPHGKKPFRPSPVISPVYGILDKNYSKDDIVDKKDGIKRERIKPIITHTQDIPSKTTEEVEDTINIDSVRNKAYGYIEEERIHEQIKVDERKKEIDSIVDDMRKNDLTMEDIPKMNKTVEDLEEINAILEETPVVNEVKEEVIEDVSKDEEIVIPSFDMNTLNNNVDNTNNIEDEIDIEINDIPEVKEHHDEEDMFDKSHILDEMEKTSTLQILDDIEKELNSIKPINRYDEDEEDNEELDEKARLDRSDTLENDLFNLIDSMYENGEEDEDNDNA